MKIVQLVPDFGNGGTEKAGCVLAVELARRGHPTSVLGWGDGPRRQDDPPPGVTHAVLPDRRPSTLIGTLLDVRPDVLQIHYAHYVEPIIRAIAAERRLRDMTVVSTPVFGRPPRDGAVLESTRTCVIGAYVYYRLLKWLGLSAEQAVRRGIGFVRLNVWEPTPVDVSSMDPPDVLAERRRELGIPTDRFVIGRLARANVSKWNRASEHWVNTILDALPRVAWASIGFPAEYGAARLRDRWGGRFVNFDETSDYARLCRILSSIDCQVFFSENGECFAFSIAEAAGLGVPTVALCTPARDNGQVEQVLDGVSGTLVASPAQAVEAIRPYADDPAKLLELKRSSWRLNLERSAADPVLERLLAFFEYARGGGREPAGRPLLDEMVREHEQFAADYHRRVSRTMSGNPLGRARWCAQLAVQESYPLFKVGRFFKRLVHPAADPDDGRFSES